MRFEGRLLSERARKVRILLETKDDYLPGPSTARFACAAAPAPVEQQPARTLRPRELDAAIDRLERQSSGREAPYSWETRKKALASSGSYRELETLLGKLRSEHPGYYRCLSLHLSGLPVDDPLIEISARLALLWLSERMPDLIRVPNEEAELHERRRHAVLSYVGSGLSLTEIAKRTGVERQKVKKILAAAAVSEPERNV